MMLLIDSSVENLQNASLRDRWKLRFMAPEQRWLFGLKQITRQSGFTLSSEARVWLF
jgi:hypothetical protein